MKTSSLSLTLCALLSGAGLFGQAVNADIPFAFNINKKVLQPGKYKIFYSSDSPVLRVKSVSDEKSTTLGIVTRMAAGIHTSDQDAHIVFDKVGDKNYLSELWLPGQDGYVLLTTKGKHTHAIVDAPTKAIEK